MDRRSIVTVLGMVLTAPLAGCLHDTTDDQTSRENETDGATFYEECNRVLIEYVWLPEEIQEEVDATLDEGQYESTDVLLADAVDTSRSYLVVNDTPYKPSVTTDEERTVLTLEEADAVRAPSPTMINVENSDSSEHEINVQLEEEDTILDETVTLEPDEQKSFETTDEFGVYDLSAKVDGEIKGSESFEFIVGDGYWSGEITVSDGEIQIVQDMAELDLCPWDKRQPEE